MEKILKDDQKFATYLAHFFLRHQDSQRLSQILQQDLSFAKKLIQDYINENNYPRVCMIVDILRGVYQQPGQNKIAICSEISDMEKVLQKVIQDQQWHIYRNYYGHNCSNSTIQLKMVTTNPEAYPDLTRLDQLSPGYVTHIWSNLCGKLTISVVNGPTHEVSFIGCRRFSGKDNECTICFLADHGNFYYTTFNQDGKVVP